VRPARSLLALPHTFSLDGAIDGAVCMSISIYTLGSGSSHTLAGYLRPASCAGNVAVEKSMCGTRSLYKRSIARYVDM